MKYLKSLLVLPFLIALNVYADECSYKEQANLNKEAALIEANYEVIKEQEPYTFVDPDTLEEMELTRDKISFKIKFYNITENLSLDITGRVNGKTNDNKIVTYTETDSGVYTFTTENTDDIVEYGIKVNALNGGCAGKTIRTFSLTKPKVNPYSQYEMCNGHESIEYCQEFTTKEYDISLDDLSKKIEEVDNNGSNQTDKENGFLKFLKNNYLYIIGGIVLIGVGTGAYIIYRKKRIL